jgi:hypothetical protein
MKFSVPVKPHVKDFFGKNPNILGKDGEVRKNSHIGLWIITVFAHPPAKNPLDYAFLEVDEDEAFPEESLTFKLTFDIPLAFITDARLILLGKILDNMTEYYGVAWLRGRLSVFPSENAASVEFMREHHINDGHVTPDSFRMAHRRMCEKGRNKKSEKSLRKSVQK